MKTSSTALGKRILLCIVLFAQGLIAQTTGKIVPWTYNTSYNPGFNTSAYEAWAYQRKTGWTTQTLPFRMLKPVGYNPSAPKYPLILMLHGRGERGTDNNYQLLWGGQKHQIAVQTGQFPGFVVFPQEPFGSWTNSEKYNASGTQPSTALSQVFELIDSMIIKYNVDPDRIYVHGLSSGGTGTWACLYNRPDLFAAALPMSTPGDETQVYKISPTPIWLFQGEEDTNPIAAISRSMMNALRNAGATDATLTKYTEYPDVAHFVWNLAYDDADFFPFMLRQNKKNIKLLGPNPIPNGGTTTLGISAGMGAYQWFRDGNPLAGATSHRLEGITLPGTYTVQFKRKPTSTTWVTSNAVVINGSNVNQPPVVSITTPEDNTSITSQTPVTVPIEASASDPDGSIAKVEFFINGVKVDEKTTAPFTTSLYVDASGAYTIQAKATDNQASATFSVIANLSVTIQNLKPTVTLTAPSNGSSFQEGESIVLSATASDPDGTIQRVDFYDGNTLLFSDLESPYSYTWLNASVASHNITAVAYDDLGASKTSDISVVHVNSSQSLGTGLTGTYYNNMYFSPPFVLKRNDATVNFAWGTASPLSGVVNTNNFSVRWTGKVLAPITGTYTFSVQGDDGVKLYVNNVLIINNFTYKNSVDVGTIALTGGVKYDIVLEYFEGGGDATIISKWSYPGQALVVVPQQYLYPSENLPAGRIALDNMAESKLTIFPNPAKDQLSIALPALTESLQVSIKSISGADVAFEETFSNVSGNVNVPLTNLMGGVYMVSVSHDGYTAIEKLVIEE